MVCPVVALVSMPDLLARIRRRDDFAHAGLVETLEPRVALEVLQVRADRPLLGELLRLFGRDVAGVERALDALRRDFPALAFRERLPQVREVRERLHRLHAVLALELL